MRGKIFFLFLFALCGLTYLVKAENGYSYGNVCVAGSQQVEIIPQDLGDGLESIDCGDGNLLQFTIGNGSYSAYNVPMYSNVGNSYRQGASWQLFTSAELLANDVYAGQVKSLAWQYVGETNATASFKIYMANTSKASFSSSSDTISRDQMMLVYNGSHEFVSGQEWNEIVFDTPFEYDGSSNICLLVVRGTEVSSVLNFRYHSTGSYQLPDYKTIYRYGRTALPNGDRSYAHRNNTRFIMCVMKPDCMPVESVSAIDVDSNAITIGWTDFRNEDASYSIEYGVAGFERGLGVMVTNIVGQMNYSATNLLSNTEYDFYVMVDCNDGVEVEPVKYSVKTSCQMLRLPYNEGFEELDFASCWTIENSDEVENTWIRNNEQIRVHSGLYSAKLLQSQGEDGVCFASPEFNVGAESAFEISFWMYRPNVSRSEDGVSVWINEAPDTIDGIKLLQIYNSYQQGVNSEASAGWYQYKATIPMSGHLFLVFKGISENNPIYIDDVEIHARPTYSISAEVSPLLIGGEVSLDGEQNSNGAYYGETVVTATASPAEHYHFLYWQLGQSPISTENPYQFVATQDCHLVAVMAIDSFSVNVVSVDSLGSVMGVGEYPYYGVARIEAIPNAHYHFKQWSDGIRTNPREVVVTDNIQLEVEFAIDSHNIVVSTNPQMGTVSGGGKYAYGSTIEIIAEANEHYHFMRWNDGDGAVQRTITVERDVEYFAIFAIDSFSVSTYIENDLLGSAAGAGDYAYGMYAELTAIAANGYEFSSWSNGVLDNPYYCQVLSDTIIEAIFSPLRYSVVVSSNNEDRGSVSGSGSFLYADTVQIVATPKYGYRFDRWSDADTNNPRMIVVGLSNMYEAIFVPIKYNVSLSLEEPDRGNLSIEDSLVDYQGEITIAANENYGYVFVQWSNGVVDNPYTLQVLSDTALVAMFVEDTFMVSVVSSNPSVGVVTGTGRYAYKSEHIITATVIDDFHSFWYWNDGDTNSVRTIIIDSNINYSAIFGGQVFTVSVSAENADVIQTNYGRLRFEEYDTITIEPHYGYSFVGWSDGVLDNPRVIQVLGNSRLTAVMIPDTFQLNVVANAMVGQVSGMGEYPFDSQIEIAAAAIEHYHFVRWNDGVIDNPRTITLRTDTTFTAIFAIDTHHVELVVDANLGNVSGSGDYSYGASSIIAAIPQSHYHFLRWSDGVLVNPRTINVLSDTIIEAIFAIDTFSISSSEDLNGEVSGIGQYPYGSEVMLSVTVDEHYHFVGWSDGNVDNPRSVLVESDAMYEPLIVIDTHAVVVSVDGSLATISGDGIYAYGSVVNIQVAPVSHYHFVSWSDGDNRNPRQITVNEDIHLTAFVAIDTQDVVIMSNDDEGEVFGDGLYEYGTMAIVEAVANGHYHFVGWSDGDTSNPRQIHVVSDTILNALFSLDEHLIQSMAVNGSVIGTGMYAYGTSVALTAQPYNHYHFIGWSDGDKSNPRMLVVESDSNLNAFFAIDTHNVVLAVDTVRGSVVGSGRYEYGSNITISALANEHCYFAGWSDGVRENPRQIHVLSDTTINALFSVDVYQVTATASTGGGSVSGVGSYEYRTIATLEAEPIAHYHFVEWNDGDRTNPRSFSVDSNISYSASFAIDTHDLNVTINETMGYVYGNGEYIYGSVVNLYVIPNEHYHFNGWGDGVLDNPRQIVLTSDTLLSVVMNIDQYRVVASASDITMGSVTGSGEYGYNTNAVLQAIPYAHHHFLSWSDGVVDNPRSMVMLQNITLTAVFASDTHIVSSTMSQTEGYIEGLGAYKYGQSIMLTAVPHSHYGFVSWSDGNTQNPRYIVVDEDITINAIFSSNVYTIDVVYDTTMGSVGGDGSFGYGTLTTLLATPNEHYHFVGWSDGVTDNPRTFTIDKDSTIAALFQIDSYHIVVYSFGEVNSLSGSGTYEYGDTVTLMVDLLPNNRVVGWYEAQQESNQEVLLSTSSRYSFVAQRDMMIVLVVEENTLTVSLSCDQTRGSVYGSGSYSYGDEIAIMAIPLPGYKFMYWSDNNTNSVRTITITDNINLVAYFILESVSVEDVMSQDVVITSQNNEIVIKNAEGQGIFIYDVAGRNVECVKNASAEQVFTMETSGVYLVKVGNNVAKKVCLIK